MELLPDFPDIELTVMALLEQVAPTTHSTPAEFVPPLIPVRKTGGTSDRFNDRPVVEVTCLGPDDPSTREMTRQCRRLILASGASTVPDVPGHPNGVYIDKATEVATPREVIYGDPARRQIASYRFVLRRPRSQ